MEQNEQLNKLIEETMKKLNIEELQKDEPIFPAETYELFKANGLSQEDIEDMEKAEIFSQLVDLLPDDEKGLKLLTDAFALISKNSTKENLAGLQAIAMKDPKLLMQMFAFTSLVEQANEEN